MSIRDIGHTIAVAISDNAMASNKVGYPTLESYSRLIPRDPASRLVCFFDEQNEIPEWWLYAADRPRCIAQLWLPSPSGACPDYSPGAKLVFLMATTAA